MKNKVLKTISLFLIILLVLPCCTTKKVVRTTPQKIVSKEPEIVPIKFPELPYTLKYIAKDLSFNTNSNTTNVSLNSDKHTITFISSRVIGHETFSSSKTVVEGNSGEAIGNNYQIPYGECEIINFDNQILKHNGNRCSGSIYYQVRVTKKDIRYIHPKFKIRDSSGLVMKIRNNNFPDLNDIEEGEVREGKISVVNQKYSDSYELIIDCLTIIKCSVILINL